MNKLDFENWTIFMYVEKLDEKKWTNSDGPKNLDEQKLDEHTRSYQKLDDHKLDEQVKNWMGLAATLNTPRGLGCPLGVLDMLGCEPRLGHLQFGMQPKAIQLSN